MSSLSSLCASKRTVSADVDVDDVVGRRERCWWKRFLRTLFAGGCAVREEADWSEEVGRRSGILGEGAGMF